MSASERLRALGADNGHVDLELGAALLALDALPLIADVVEAAEEWEEYRENIGMMRVYAYVPKTDLRDALTALREHLEGGDVT